MAIPCIVRWKVLGFILSACLLSAEAASRAASCIITPSIAPRAASSWVDAEGNTNQIYDITVTNSGLCPVTSVGLRFKYADGVIVDTWNMMEEYRHYLLQNFGDNIAVGKSNIGAGIIVSSKKPVASDDVIVEVYGVACPRDCKTSFSSSSEGSYSGSASASSSSSEQQTASDSVSSSSSGYECRVRSVFMNSSKTWMDEDGNTYSVYSLSIANHGPCAITEYALSFELNRPNAQIISMYNLEPMNGGYHVKGFDALAPGTAFSGAGLIVKSATPDLEVIAHDLDCNAICKS